MLLEKMYSKTKMRSEPVYDSVSILSAYRQHTVTFGHFLRDQVLENGIVFENVPGSQFAMQGISILSPILANGKTAKICPKIKKYLFIFSEAVCIRIGRSEKPAKICSINKK